VIPLWRAIPVETAPMMNAILLVQPDPTLRGAWSRAIRRAGIQVHAAAGLMDAYATIRHRRIDAAIVDVTHAGVSDGLLGVFETWKVPAVVLVTASDTPTRAFLHVRAAATLRAPCTPDALLEALRRLPWHAVERPTVDEDDGERTWSGEEMGRRRRLHDLPLNVPSLPVTKWARWLDPSAVPIVDLLWPG
jgi:DNA-binding NtrC family response regulator